MTLAHSHHGLVWAQTHKMVLVFDRAPRAPWGPVGGPRPPHRAPQLMQDKWGGSKWGVQVCWLGPKPQGTPSHTFLPPNGSPSHHFGPGNRGPTQNSSPDLAVGVLGPESQLLFHPFLIQKCQNANQVQVLKLLAPIASDLGAQGPKEPRGSLGGSSLFAL